VNDPVDGSWWQSNSPFTLAQLRSISAVVLEVFLIPFFFLFLKSVLYNTGKENSVEGETVNRALHRRQLTPEQQKKKRETKPLSKRAALYIGGSQSAKNKQKQREPPLHHRRSEWVSTPQQKRSYTLSEM
jgi:heme/copper-type cytochrome/quinol oxidase subunit 1